MPKYRTHPTPRRHGRLWLAFVLPAAAMAAGLFWPGAGPGPDRRAAWAGPASPDAKRRPVLEIRFGVVEPPVVAQRDITVLAPVSNVATTSQPLECSGIAWDGESLLIASDRHGQGVFTCPIDLDRMTIGRPKLHVLIGNEQRLLADAESLTLNRTKRGVTGYILCSMSNDCRERPLPQRRHLARFVVARTKPFTARSATVLDAGAIRQALQEQFRAVGIEPYRAHYDAYLGPEKNTYRWGNIEGISFGPLHNRLLCGMRNPLLGGEALLLCVRGVDEAFDAADDRKLAVADLFTLDLDGRGVSDLCWDGLTGGYLIAAATSSGPRLDKDHPYPPRSLDAALFWWSGRKGEKPICFARVPDMTIEAICRLGDSRYIAIASDEGDQSEGREHQQSVLTVLDFTGIRYAQ